MKTTLNTVQKIESRPGCIQSALEIVGDKWTPLILRELAESAKTFGAIEDALHLSPRTLSQRLDKLEITGIINKQIYCQKPPRYKYSLSSKGQELLDILRAMADWGEKHHTSSNCV